MDDRKVHEISKSLGKDPAQLLVSWGVQRGTVVLPKSVTPARIASNFEHFIIPSESFFELNALEHHQRFNFSARGGFDIFDEEGEENVKG